MTVVSFSIAYRSFRGGSGRLDTRLDTPPSINRRHPDSRLARGAAIVAACTSRSLVPGSNRSTKSLECKREQRKALVRKGQKWELPNDVAYMLPILASPGCTSCSN